MPIVKELFEFRWTELHRIRVAAKDLDDAWLQIMANDEFRDSNRAFRCKEMFCLRLSDNIKVEVEVNDADND